VKKIIFVFSNHTNAEAFTTALTQEGYQVRWMANENDEKYIWVEVVMPTLNIRD